MDDKLTAEQIKELTTRAQAIRRDIVKILTEATSGHPGGSLSAVDILTTLYFTQMKVDPQDPLNKDRDRFVLSKGHAAPALYAVLARKGFFPLEDLTSIRKIDSHLQGHPDMRRTPGVDMSTGSLGQGISAACGMALAGKLDRRDYRVYTLLGDGELQEGQVWEAAMLAAHYKLDNLTAFVDFNGLQIDGKINDVLSPLPIPEKWLSFGWWTTVVDGHDINAIYQAVNTAKKIKDRPSVIIAKTVKGSGVRQMENQASWHGKAPTREECETFLKEMEEMEKMEEGICCE